jgi:hypothetical protein
MDGAKLYDAACKMGLEGIVAKRRDRIIAASTFLLRARGIANRCAASG